MFYPATSTVGKAFLNLKGGANVVGVDEVSSMGGEYKNMKMLGYKGGVRSQILARIVLPSHHLSLCKSCRYLTIPAIGSRAQFVTRAKYTINTVSKMRQRGEPIADVVSLNSRYGSHITAVMFDPSSKKETLFEQLLPEVPDAVRAEFVEFKKGYTAPAECRHLLDKAELEIFLKNKADGFTSDEVKQFVSDKAGQGGEGLPAWDDGCWVMLIEDIKKKTRYLSNDVEQLPTPGKEESGSARVLLDEELMEPLDENYLPLSCVNLGAKMAQVGAISISDSPPSPMDETPSEQVEATRRCSYPLCAHEGLTLRSCACDEHSLHHLCATNNGEEVFPPRCWHCMVADVAPPAPPGSQKNRVAAADDDPDDPDSDSEGSHVSGTEADDSDEHDEPAATTTKAATPTKTAEPMQVATTPETPRSSPVVRMSPAPPRSPVPATNKHRLFGWAIGEAHEVPGDNSCFYHSIRAAILADPELHCDQQALELLGDSPRDLRDNLRRICEGTSELASVDGVNLGARTYDLRVGAPPPDQAHLPPSDRFQRESLDDIAAGAADINCLAKYGRLVAKKDHWGCEVDLILVAEVIDRVCQFGNVVNKAFVPNLQATPTHYDFTSKQEPLRLEHNKVDHFQPFFAAVIPPEGFAAAETEDEDEDEDEDEEEEDVPALVEQTEPAARPPLTLLDALKPKASAVAAASSPGSKAILDNVLEELLAMNEQAAQAAEAGHKHASSPLSKLLAGNKSKVASRAQLAAQAKYAATHALTKPLVSEALDMAEGRRARAKEPSKEIPVAGKSVSALEDTLKKKLDQMQEDQDRRLKELQDKLEAKSAADAKALAEAESKLKVKEKKIAEIEQRRKDKLASEKAAERRQREAKLADELREIRELEGAKKDEPITGNDEESDSKDDTVKVSIGDTITMTLGSRTRKRGTVTEYVGDGKYRVELDSGEAVEAQLSGPNRKEFRLELEPPPDLVRFKGNECARIFHTSGAVVASLQGTIESTCFTVTDSLEAFDTRPSTKASREWIEACGVGKTIFVSSLSPSVSHPKPMDMKATLRFNKDGKSCVVDNISMHVCNVASYDPLTKTVLEASEKGVGVVLGVFGAGANQEAAIAGKDGRRWKATSDDKSSPHVPLDVRHLNADINTFSELRYISCPDAADLQKAIGLPAYLQVVRQLGAHPLFRPLVAAQWPNAMACSDILTALRALADGKETALGTEVLAKHIADTAAMSVSTPIERKYEDQEAEGIMKKEAARAITDYKKGTDAMFSILTPGTTALSKVMPRVPGRTTWSQLIDGATRTHTPVLPRIKTAARAPPSAAPPPPSSAGSAPSAASAPPKKTRSKISSLVPSSALPVLPQAAAPTAQTASDDAELESRPRKSAIGLKGSPLKPVHDAAPEATKRGKVSSAEELAESMNALPAMLAKLEEAAKVVQAAKESEVSSKDEQIRLLTAQLESANQTIESANQKIARLEAEKSMLMQSNMESMVKAAKAEGAAEQLEANVKMRERQLESWVSRRLSLALHHADLCLCEEDGSVVPPR